MSDATRIKSLRLAMGVGGSEVGVDCLLGVPSVRAVLEGGVLLVNSPKGLRRPRIYFEFNFRTCEACKLPQTAKN